MAQALKTMGRIKTKILNTIWGRHCTHATQKQQAAVQRKHPFRKALNARLATHKQSIANRKTARASAKQLNKQTRAIRNKKQKKIRQKTTPGTQAWCNHIIAAQHRAQRQAMHILRVHTKAQKRIDKINSTEIRINHANTDAKLNAHHAIGKPVIIDKHHSVTIPIINSKAVNHRLITHIKNVKYSANLVKVLSKQKINNVQFKVLCHYLQMPKGKHPDWLYQTHHLSLRNRSAELRKYNQIEHLISGKRVKKIRKRLHFTQADLAAVIGISPSTLSQIEQDKQAPSKLQNNMLCMFTNPCTAYQIIQNNLPRLEHMPSFKKSVIQIKKTADFLRLQE